MKKLIAISVSIMLFLMAGNVSGQIANHGIGFNLGTNLFVGDYPDIPISDSKLMPNFGVYTYYQVSPKLTLKFQTGYGQLKSLANNFQFKTDMIPVELTGMMALSGSKSFPFIKAGLGLVNFRNNGQSAVEGMAIGGLGVNLNMSPALSFLISGDFRYLTDDKMNGVAGGLNDGYFSLQTGLSYNLSKDKEFQKEDSQEKSKILAEAQKIEEAKQPEAESVAQNDIYLDLIRLRSRIERLEEDIKEKDNQIEGLMTLITDKDSKLSELQTQVAAAETSTPQTQPALAQAAQNEAPMTVEKVVETANQVNQKYEIALNNFNAGNYRAAIMELEELSANYSDHGLASNFIYWIGESYFALKNYELALKSFEEISGFNWSTKFDYALYMSGRCLLKMGETGMAAQKFKKLVDDHPNSVLANKASRLLQSMQREIIS